MGCLPSHRHYPWLVSDCTTALEESINIPTLLIIFSATFKSCLNNRFLFHFCVYVLAWLVIKIYTRCKEEVFWLGGTFAPLCVTMGFHSFVLPRFCWLVLFSQIWVASGPLLEWRDLGKHWLFVPELLVLLLRFPCACLDLCPPSCSCTEQLMGRKAALQLHCSTLGPHCHLSTRSSVMELGLVILIIQPINWAWLSRFLIVTWLLARCCCTQWSHVRIERQLGPFSLPFFFFFWSDKTLWFFFFSPLLI